MAEPRNLPLLHLGFLIYWIYQMLYGTYNVLGTFLSMLRVINHLILTTVLGRNDHVSILLMEKLRYRQANGTCPGSHSSGVAEPGFLPGACTFTPWGVPLRDLEGGRCAHTCECVCVVMCARGRAGGHIQAAPPSRWSGWLWRSTLCGRSAAQPSQPFRGPVLGGVWLPPPHRPPRPGFT